MGAPRLELPPRGALAPNSDVDPLRYYYAPVIGRVFAARLNVGLRLLGARRFRRLLEVGYGSGLLLPTLARIADTVDGIDLASDPEDVRRSVGALGVAPGELRRADVRALPFPDDTFDGAVAFSILEHLPPDELAAALGELARVLAPGGALVVGCPAVHRAMNAAFAAIGFRGIERHHLSSILDVLDAAASAGLVVEERATLPTGVPLGWAPYNAILLHKREPARTP